MQKILLVEDQKDFQLMALNCLSDQYLMTVAGSLSEARERMKTEDFDMVLMDVMLPDGSGFEFVRRLKENQFLRHIPVVFLTSKSEIDERSRGLGLGAEDYIAKPYMPREFTARITARLKLFAAPMRSRIALDLENFSLKSLKSA